MDLALSNLQWLMCHKTKLKVLFKGLHNHLDGLKLTSSEEAEHELVS